MPYSFPKPSRAACGTTALLLAFATGSAAAAPSQKELAEQATWRDAIRHLAAPAAGCFTASYPTLAWITVPCVAAPTRPYIPRTLSGSSGRLVGNGHDYAADTKSLTNAAIGAFPSVTGLKSETGYGGAKNTYSLQLNSGFMNTAGCNGSTTGTCQTWQQFVYSSSEQAVFMQYWLINYGSTCPSAAWNRYEGSCYRNSAAVSAPTIAATKLGTLAVTGTATAGGNDTETLTASTTAYRTSGNDSVVDLANGWKASEFNVVGDGGGSEAKFNKGTAITVTIGVTDANASAPTCAANAGTTGETNNLSLGSCSASGGAAPQISFTESN